jgi:hypothetical protein
MRLATAVRGFLAVALLAGALSSAFGSAPPPVSRGATPTIGERFAAIGAMGMRTEGSKAEVAAFEYVIRELRAAGLEPVSSGFSDAEEGFSTSRIVEARLRGALADELAIIVPVGSWADSPDPSEGAFGIALALDEAAKLSALAGAASKLPISLRFVFLGAENRGRKSDGETASLGSRTWIGRQAARSRLAVLYLSMGAPASRIRVRSAGKGVLSPFWYYEGARRALEPSGIEYDLQTNRLQAYRLGLASDYGPASSYLEAGIPAIELLGESARADSLQGISAQGPSSTWFGNFIELFSTEEKGGFADTWDRHYFIFQIGKVSVVLREKTYVAFLVAMLAIVASSFLIATVARRDAAKRLLRRVPTITAEAFALFIALALVFLAGKAIAWVDAMALGGPEAWRLSPRTFAAARILFSFFLFLSLISFLVEKRVLTPNPYFYEFAALACLAVDSLVFSAADLSASFYFMWALVFVELSLAARRRWATLLAYVLMYAPLLIITSELAARPELSVYRKLIAPEYLGLLSLSALTLPFFVFTASPLLFFARRGAAARKRTVALFAALAIAVEALALGYAVLSSPLSGPRRKDLKIAESIDQDAGQFELELSGLRSLGKGELDREGSKLEYDTGSDRAYLRGEDRKERIGIGEKATPFLDRVDEALTIRFAAPPYSVDLSLESAGETLIYDCNLPFKVAVDGKRTAIYSGVLPGSRLDLSLTVPSSFRARLIVVARYLAPLAACTQSSGSPLAEEGFAVKASFELGAKPR